MENAQLVPKHQGHWPCMRITFHESLSTCIWNHFCAKGRVIPRKTTEVTHTHTQIVPPTNVQEFTQKLHSTNCFRSMYVMAVSSMAFTPQMERSEALRRRWGACVHTEQSDFLSRSISLKCKYRLLQIICNKTRSHNNSNRLPTHLNLCRPPFPPSKRANRSFTVAHGS